MTKNTLFPDRLDSPGSNRLPARHKVQPYLCYTLLFLLCLAELMYLMRDRSFIRKADANHQHYQAVVFYGWWLRQGIKRILSGRGSFLPWSLKIGLGADVVTTLHYYALGDPLMLLSALFTRHTAESFYSFIVVFRLYLAGLSCLFFLRRRNLGSAGSVLGAIIYVFSGYGLNPGIFHPFFAIPMVCFPLLLVGVEEVYSRRSYGLFILAVFLSAISNLYFFYMLGIFTALYALFRYFTRGKEVGPADFALEMLKFGGTAILGCCLAAPVLLPNVISILSSDRLNVTRDRLIFYPAKYYQHMAAAMLGNYGSYYFFAAVSPVAVLMLLILISTPLRRYLYEKITLAVLFLTALLPAVGSFLNGNAYATNRWIWAMILAFSWCTGRIVTDLDSLQKGTLVRSVGFTAIFTVLCLLPRDVKGLAIIVPLILLWISLFLLLLFSGEKRYSYLKILLTGLVIAGVFTTNWITFHPDFGNHAVSYIKRGAAEMLHSPDFFQVLSEQEDHASTRYEIYDVPYYVNDSMLFGLNSDSYYFSSSDPGTTSFRRSQWTSNSLAQRFNGLDMREFLTLPLGVRYVVVPEEHKDLHFFTYDTVVAVADDCIVYASDYALPLVYVYDSVLPQSAVPDVLQRQEALLQFAVVEDEVETSLPLAVPEYTFCRLPWTLGERTEGVILDGMDVVAEQENAVLELRFPAPGMTELCLLAEGVQYDRSSSSVTEVIIPVTDGVRTSSLTITTPLDNFYCGYEDYLINLGYLEEGRDSILLTFPRAGTYHFRDLTVAALSMEKMKDRAVRLQQSGVTSSSIEDGTVSFEVSRTEAGMACIAIPYNTGWTVFVDGIPAPLLSINGGLCGVELSAGTHTVRMQYHTPWFTEGLLLAGSALMLICIWTISDRRRLKNLCSKTREES